MLKNFHLAAIVKQASAPRLLQVPLSQALQHNLADSWQEQYEKFVKDSTGFFKEIDFNAGYKPEEHERFRLSNYKLPEWLATEDSSTVVDLDTLSSGSGTLLNFISGIVAFARDEQDKELVLFQNFSHSHVIQPGRFLLRRRDTYESAEHPGLKLDGKLSAVYEPANEKLLFHNFRTVNSFLPLSDFYSETSEKEILEVLNHKLFKPEDPNALATNANQWLRKRFAMLRDSGVLDQHSARTIQSCSEGYDVEIRISKDKIVFPAEKSAAKRLLQFLNEELYRGPITENLYETNSKRKADQ